MATVKIEADGACQELHGVFQFTDDLFAEEMRQKEYIPPTYIPRTIRPQWFMRHSSDNLVILKHQIDWLFYKRQYGEACQRVKYMMDALWTGATGTRRELFEAILECALKARDTDLVQQMYKYLASIRVEDSSLGYVLAKASAFLENSDSHHHTEHIANDENNNNYSNRGILS